ncbi:hypothetical protein TPHA_0O00220 [Tetrapisispora phaffii CBS 4417]|uniref:Exportin-T n=1 Tax=Tetrapisispora phaffii (strain ATCC 24235 / CBS 4417 / NBRC 1672 / NRRL Y-8282 / UCD 70-5) TaxID=1071381 RepID=G8C1G6_TETPH|nr:hypothetical protein TPHA_0O00220 [Tetrapisispora phaffii CBS 4417]CCE65994.1 hypothetical protein TPHA_0O00220 [Tetrapisispora phaffii CBS 4417]
MLNRIKEVVVIANNPATDALTKKQALDYLESLKNDAGSVEVLASLLVDNSLDDLTLFVILQLIGDMIGTTITNVNNMNEIVLIKGSVISLLRRIIENNLANPEYIRNKISELVTKIFYFTYGDVNNNVWSSFFNDIIPILCIDALLTSNIETIMNNQVSFSEVGYDFFTRICISINSEIADQTFLRSKEVQVINNHLKDYMRITDVNTMTLIWYNGLLHFKNKIALEGQHVKTNASKLANLTLACIGNYISWINVTLIVNQNYIDVIYSFMDYNTTKIACSQCLIEIISKKMKPLEKLQLLNMLNLTEKLITNKEKNFTDNEDLEIIEQLAKLTSCVGLEYSIILEQCNENNSNNNNNSSSNNSNNNNGLSTTDADQNLDQIAVTADQQILTEVAPLVLKFFIHEYDSVTEQCFDFISQYLNFLKKIFAIGGKPGTAISINSKKQPLDQEHSSFLVSLINGIFKKMKIDSDTVDVDDDSIQEFNDTIRSKLKNFQDVIAIINPNLYLEQISNNITACLSAKYWPDMELAIFQMHNLSESIRNNLFGLNKSDISTSPATAVMGKFLHILLTSSNLFSIDNRYVQILFFELVVRHYTFLTPEIRDELSLLNIFCSEFGMFNRVEKVRVRVWYLFTRFIKTTKPKLSTVVLTQIVSKISPLLVIEPVQLNANGSEDLNNVTFDNQLYIFEGVGLLIGANSDYNYDILDQVLTPLFTELEKCISTQSQTLNQQNQHVILQSHHILMAVGTIARGTHIGLVPENQVNNALVNEKYIHKSLIEKFSNIAEVVLVTFSYFNKHETIRDASRFTFARLIPILNNGIVSYANKLIYLFLESELKVIELNDFLGFLGQMLHTFHQDESFYKLFDELLTIIIEKIHILLDQLDTENNDGYNLTSASNSGAKDSNMSGKTVVVTDSFRDRILLKKAYYTFLQTLVTNNVTSLLLTQRNRSVLPTILTDLLEYSPQEIQETYIMKLALSVIHNFIKCFGSGACTDNLDRHANEVGKLDGLNEFFITKTIPLMFEIPFKPEYKFDIKDGSCRVMACDISRILKELCIQSGGQDITSNPALKYLTEIYFPQIQLPSEISLELIQALVNQDMKPFEKYFVSLITRLTT